MVAPYVVKAVVGEEECACSYYHGTEHQVGGCGADADTVEQESAETGYRNGQYPIKIFFRCRYDCLVIGQ